MAYNQGLAGKVQIPVSTPGADHAWGLYSILVEDEAARARVQEACKTAGVPTAIYYPKSLHRQPAYAGAHAGAISNAPELPVSEMLCRRIMSLPMHPYLSDSEVSRVIAAVAAAV
jgi:dTDP-4-amino-4,6-dideoxygalactose transaminase